MAPRPPTPPRLQDNFGIELERTEHGGIRGVMPIGPPVTNGRGALSAGAVGCLVDEVGGVGASGAAGAHAVTSHAALRVDPVLPSGSVVAEAAVARVGRTSVVSVLRVSEERTGRPVATGTFTSTVLRGTAGSHQLPTDRAAPSVWAPRPEPLGRAATDVYLGMARDSTRDGHGAHLAFHEGLRNVADVLHGGGLMLIIEHAALLATGAEDLGGDVDDLDVHFLAPGKIGPLRTRTSVTRHRDSGRNFSVVEVFDEGCDNRLIGLGLAGSTVRSP